MTELERSLRLLGEALAFPEAPDVSEAVQRRLVDIRPQRRSGGSKRVRSGPGRAARRPAPAT